MPDVGVLKAILSLDTRQFARGLRASSRQIEQAGRRMESIGRKMTLAVSAPLIGAGVVATKFAVDFDATLSTIIGLVGVAGDQVQEWREQILQLAPAVGKGPQELAEAMFFITSAGLRGAEAMETLTVSAKAAGAGLGDTAQVADAATSAMNAFRSQNLNAGDAVGILVATIREGKLEADSLAGALGQVLPIASKVGITFNEVGAALAGMTRIGLSAELSVTSLKALLTTLDAPATDAQEALAQMGLSVQDLRDQIQSEGLLAVLTTLKETFGDNADAMNAIFGNVRAATGAFALIGDQAEKVKEIFESLRTAGVEDVNRAFEVFAATAKFQLGQALANVKVAAIRLGEVLVPILVPAVKRLGELAGELAEKFRSLSPKMQSVVLITAGLAIVIPPVLIVLGLMATGLAAIGTAAAFAASAAGTAFAFIAAKIVLISTPVWLAVGAVAGLTAAWLLFKDEISAVAARVVEVLGPVVSAILGVAKTAAVIVVAFNPVTIAIGVAMALWAEFGDTISRVASNVVDTLKDWALAFAGWGRSVAEVVFETVAVVREWLVDRFNTIVVEPVRKLIDNVLGFFRDLFERVLDIAGRFVPGFAEKFDEIKAAIAEKIGGGVEIAEVHLSRVEGAFDDIAGRAESAFDQIDGFVSSGAKGIQEGLVGAIKSAKDAIVDLIPVADAAAFSLDKMAEDATAAIESVVPKTEETTDKVTELGDAGTRVARTFEDSFADLIVSVKKGENAFADFVGSVLRGIQRIAAQRLAKGVVNSVLGAFGVARQGAGATAGASGGGGIGGAIKKIFGFAEGGLVTRPTLALIGEKGPEAVVPLSRKFGQLESSGLSTSRVNVTVINNGQPVDVESVRERQSAFGRDIEIVIENVASRSMQSGRLGQATD